MDDKEVKEGGELVLEMMHIETLLRGMFPHGHKDFIPMCIDDMNLHSDKNHDYAHGGKATGNFDRVAKILALYPGLSMSSAATVAIIYLMKQLDAALWLRSSRHTAKVQGSNERWQDVSVYAKIISILEKEEEA